jgi:hypothetical protein
MLDGWSPEWVPEAIPEHPQVTQQRQKMKISLMTRLGWVGGKFMFVAPYRYIYHLHGSFKRLTIIHQGIGKILLTYFLVIGCLLLSTHAGIQAFLRWVYNIFK